jgi:hypothetical protein
MKTAEPVFLNVYGAQESIPRNAFRQPMPKLFKNSSSDLSCGAGLEEYEHKLEGATFFVVSLVPTLPAPALLTFWYFFSLL